MPGKPTSSGNTGRRLRVDALNPDAAALEAAADVLRQKGVIVFPTSGLYGLGADALCAEAVARVFAIKRRPADKPVLVLVSGLDDLERLVRTIPDFAQPLMGLWPGGVTLIFEARRIVPAALTAGTGKIGVRLPAHPVARMLLDRFGGPVTGTSANLSGSPAVAAIDQLAPDIASQVDVVVDAGPLAGGPGSTIVDATAWPIRVLREGAVPRAAIDRLLA